MNKLKWFAYGFFTCFALCAAASGYWYWYVVQFNEKVDAYANLRLPSFEPVFMEDDASSEMEKRVAFFEEWGKLKFETPSNNAPTE